jgi:hypothetical protein
MKKSRLKKAYDEPEPGEWIVPIRRGYRLCCCDCGLVHTLDLEVKEGRARFRVFRNNRSTALVRLARTPQGH